MSDSVQRIPPSYPGYDFSAADLKNFTINQQEIARIIMQRTTAGTMDGTGLLAAILRVCKKSNASYSPIPFGLDDYQSQQITGADPLRSFLCIQNVGSGDLMVVFQAGSPVIEDFSGSADSQNVLNLLQLQSFRIVAGGNFFPDTPPNNPITIFTLGTATQGVVMVGQ